MNAWIIYGPDGDYFGLAYGERDRKNQLDLVAMISHREGYAEPYETAVREDCRVDAQRREREIAEMTRQTALEAARRRGDKDMIAILEADERMAAE